MKTHISILSSILVLTLFTNCASSQFDKNPSFTVEKAQHQEWIGGKPGSKGIMVTIEFTDKVEDNIKFDSIYFNGKSTNLSIGSFSEKTIISGNFGNSNFSEKIVIMDKDPKKEFGNDVPKKNKELPFELSKNECVISYVINNKKLYFKLDTLQKGKAIIYP